MKYYKPKLYGMSIIELFNKLKYKDYTIEWVNTIDYKIVSNKLDYIPSCFYPQINLVSNKHPHHIRIQNYVSFNGVNQEVLKWRLSYGKIHQSFTEEELLIKLNELLK